MSKRGKMPIQNLKKVKYIKNFPKFTDKDINVQAAVSFYIEKRNPNLIVQKQVPPLSIPVSPRESFQRRQEMTEEELEAKAYSPNQDKMSLLPPKLLETFQNTRDPGIEACLVKKAQYRKNRDNY